MALRRVDDLDPAVHEDVQTLTFALGDSAFTIDLGPANRERLSEVLAPFIAAAQPAQSQAATPGDAARTRGVTPDLSVVKPAAEDAPRRAPRNEENARIREWASARGYEVSPRGRISAEIRAEYEKAQEGSQGVPEAQVPGQADGQTTLSAEA